MIRIFYKSTRDKTLTILPEFRPNTWIHVEQPTRAELTTLVDTYNLEASLLQDAVDIQEVPRVEVEDGIVYIFTRFVLETDEVIDTTPMLIALKKDCIISVSLEKFPRLENLIQNKFDINTAQKNKVLFALFQQINDTYNDYLNRITKRLRSLSVRVEKIKNKDIIQFVNFENILYDFNTSLVRLNTIYNSLVGGRVVKINEREQDLIEDLYLSSGQLIQITKESLQNIVNILEGYSAILTNNLNRIIKLFTSLTIILTVPTVIGTFYGMNVQLPFASSPHAFQGIIFITLVICLLLLILFTYKDWL